MLKDWMKGFPKKLQRQMVFADNLFEIAKKEETDFFVVACVVLRLMELKITEPSKLKEAYRKVLDREKAKYAKNPAAYQSELKYFVDAMLAARG
jgi:hypothetical protein